MAIAKVSKLNPTHQPEGITEQEKLTTKQINLLIKEKLSELAEMEIDTPEEVVALWKQCIKYCFSELGTGSRESLRILEGMNKTITLLEKLVPHLQASVNEQVDQLEAKAGQLAELVEARTVEVQALKDACKQITYERDQVVQELNSLIGKAGKTEH